MIALFTADQVRKIDQQAMSTGIAGYALMQRAARAALQVITRHWPQTRYLMVFCGSGNNAGDGYEIARQAVSLGMEVQVFALSAPEALNGDARVAAQAAVAAGVPCQLFDTGIAQQWFLMRHAQQTVLIDTLLGIGGKGALRPEYLRAVNFINSCEASVMAMDLPTGVCADTGYVDSQAVVADITLSVVARKRGLYTGDAPAFTGALLFDDLAISGGVPSARGIDSGILKTAALARKRTAHKGDSGHVLIIGGDTGFGGAAVMAAEAAARSGAGTVSLITRPVHVTTMLTRCPEVMVRGIDERNGHAIDSDAAESALGLISRASVIVLGPGLGRSPWSLSLLYTVLERAAKRNIPLVLDADALNLLALQNTDWQTLASDAQRAQWIVTPHPGEAARLLGCQTIEINRDRFTAARSLQQKTGCVVILKGAGSLLAFPDVDTPMDICLEGNPGMASGGMGDVLSGICGALLALGLSGTMKFDASEAARLAVCAHGEAADLAAAAIGQRGLLATDVFRFLPGLLSGGGK